MKTEKTCRNHVVSMLAGASLAAGLGLFAAPQAGAVVLGGVYQAPGLQPDIAWTSPNIVTRGDAHAMNSNADPLRDPALPNDGLVMRLTPDSPSQSGSAFFNEGYILENNSDFTMKFQFRLAGAQTIDGRADGIAFIVTSNSTVFGEQGPSGLDLSALALSGEGLGYGKGFDPFINIDYAELQNSFIVEFDTFQNGFDTSSSHIAFMQNGDQTVHYGLSLNGTIPTGAIPTGSTSTGSPMDNGHKWEAVIRYFGQGDLLIVTVDDLDQAGNNGASFSLTGIDVPAIMGNCGSAGCGPSYFGFTAGTGARFSSQDILGAELTVPEPGVIPLFAAGFAGLFFIGRRRRASLF